MDAITFMRKFTLVRLFFESLVLVVFMMALTAHAAFMTMYVVIDQNGSMSPSSYRHSPEVAIAWLFFYFMVPRTLIGWFGFLTYHTPAIAVHAILTAVVTVMYSVLGVVCVFTESSIELTINFVVVGIEISSLVISYKLLQDARIKGGSRFDWKRFIGDQVEEQSAA